MSAEMVGISFAVEGGRAWYVAVPENQAEAQEFVDAFRPFFENEGQIKVGQNLKYDLTILSHYGVEVKGELFDTMLAHYVVEPEQRHNMDYLAETYLHYRTIHIEELIGTGRQQKNMRDLAPSEICDYACEDADVTLRLYPILREKMAECDVTDVFSKIEMPLMPVLARIEQNGVRLDTEALQQTGDDFRARLQTLEEEVYALAGHEFTITSPKQVGTVLFEELKVSEKARKTKTGQYSTSEEVLETLRDKHPIVEKILAHARSRNSSPPTSKLSRSSSMHAPVASTLPSIRQLQPPVASRRRTRICKTSLFAEKTAERFAKPSCPTRIAPSSAPTIRRSSCASWHTSAATST